MNLGYGRADPIMDVVWRRRSGESRRLFFCTGDFVDIRVSSTSMKPRYGQDSESKQWSRGIELITVALSCLNTRLL